MSALPGISDWPNPDRQRSSRAPVSLDVDEASLHEAVTRILSDHLGRTVAVTGLKRRGSPFATLFPADVLSLEIDGSQQVRLFLKHLGREEEDHPDKLGPRREVDLYASVFQDDTLPVPRCFGAVESPASGRIQLFLEYVDDWNLKYQDLEHWYRAAQELGRMHAWFAARPASIEGCPVLQRLGAEYVWTWAALAAKEADRRDARLGRRVAALLNDYEPVAAVLEVAEATLVHNDLSPKNVLADRSQDPARIHFIDWESAGLGCGVLDLVNLSYGLDSEARDEMRRSYVCGLTVDGHRSAVPDDLGRLEAAAEAHKALWRLAHCGVWDLPDASVRQFCSEAETAAAKLRTRGRQG